MEIIGLKRYEKNINILMLIFFLYSINFIAIDEEFIRLPFRLGMYLFSLGLISIYFSNNYLIRLGKEYKIRNFLNKPKSFFGIIIMISWYLFAFILLISQVINADQLMTSILIITVIPIIFMNIIPNVLSNPIITISKASMFANLIIIIQSFVMSSNIIEQYNASISAGYRGIIGNSNVLGLFAMQLGVSASALLLGQIEKKNKISIINVVSLLISIFTLLITKSRTSLATLVIIIVFALFILFKLGESKKALSFIFGGALLSIIFFRDVFINGVLLKLTTRSSEGNILASRNVIWNRIFDDSTFLGNGPMYFTDKVGISSHNSVLHFWGENGVLVGLFLGIFMLCILVYCLLYLYKKMFRDYSYIPAMYIISFSLVSFMETLITGTSWSPTYVYFLMSGYLIFGRATFPKNSKLWNK